MHYFSPGAADCAIIGLRRLAIDPPASFARERANIAKSTGNALFKDKDYNIAICWYTCALRIAGFCESTMGMHELIHRVEKEYINGANDPGSLKRQETEVQTSDVETSDTVCIDSIDVLPSRDSKIVDSGHKSSSVGSKNKNSTSPLNTVDKDELSSIGDLCESNIATMSAEQLHKMLKFLLPQASAIPLAQKCTPQDVQDAVVYYSNRAESYLRIHRYREAFHDTSCALCLDQGHKKSLSRFVRSLEGLKHNVRIDDRIEILHNLDREAVKRMKIHGFDVPLPEVGPIAINGVSKESANDGIMQDKRSISEDGDRSSTKLSPNKRKRRDELAQLDETEQMQGEYKGSPLSKQPLPQVQIDSTTKLVNSGGNETVESSQASKGNTQCGKSDNEKLTRGNLARHSAVDRAEENEDDEEDQEETESCDSDTIRDMETAFFSFLQKSIGEPEMKKILKKILKNGNKEDVDSLLALRNRIPDLSKLYDSNVRHWEELGARLQNKASCSKIDAPIASSNACVDKSAVFSNHPLPSKPFKLKLHPKDRMSEILDVYKEDPWSFEPRPDPKTQVMEQWGLGINRSQLALKIDMRNAQCQSLYAQNSCSIPPPEVQFIQVLALRKQNGLRESRETARQRFSCDYILRITLEHVEPKVWRRLRVSGGVTLASFQDKVVLLPFPPPFFRSVIA